MPRGCKHTPTREENEMHGGGTAARTNQLPRSEFLEKYAGRIASVNWIFRVFSGSASVADTTLVRSISNSSALLQTLRNPPPPPLARRGEILERFQDAAGVAVR